VEMTSEGLHLMFRIREGFTQLLGLRGAWHDV
jgi:hypothetical protein